MNKNDNEFSKFWKYISILSCNSLTKIPGYSSETTSSKRRAETWLFKGINNFCIAKKLRIFANVQIKLLTRKSVLCEKQSVSVRG